MGFEDLVTFLKVIQEERADKKPGFVLNVFHRTLKVVFSTE